MSDNCEPLQERTLVMHISPRSLAAILLGLPGIDRNLARRVAEIDEPEDGSEPPLLQAVQDAHRSTSGAIREAWSVVLAHLEDRRLLAAQGFRVERGLPPNITAEERQEAHERATSATATAFHRALVLAAWEIVEKR